MRFGLTIGASVCCLIGLFLLWAIFPDRDFRKVQFWALLLYSIVAFVPMVLLFPRKLGERRRADFIMLTEMAVIGIFIWMFFYGVNL